MGSNTRNNRLASRKGEDMKHNDKQLLQASTGLVKMVMELTEQCDISKLDAIEIEKLDELKAQARMMFIDFSAYDKSEEDKSFK